MGWCVLLGGKWGTVEVHADSSAADARDARLEHPVVARRVGRERERAKRCTHQRNVSAMPQSMKRSVRVWPRCRKSTPVPPPKKGKG
eukprot:3715026-Rhodomonas_salina.4